MDIKKLKAVALNARNGAQGRVDFQGTFLPATVLELIAEVEKLRAELAAGAAREGGNTNEKDIA